MHIETTRFGNIELSAEDFIDFPEGILGFAGLRHFVLLDDPNDEIFAWLQSCESGEIAFPILEPELFESQYKVKLSKHDLEALKLPSMERTRLFVIVTIPEDVTQMTANMKAPIVINVLNRIGRQCVLQDNELSIREMIFSRLQQRLYQHPAQPIKTAVSTTDKQEVVIRIPDSRKADLIK